MTMTLEQNPQAYIKTPQGIGAISKTQRYGWKLVDAPGELEHISKLKLKIDHDYQRNEISDKIISDISSSFSWIKFGVIQVARRSDLSLWVFDGQHRVLGAMRVAAVDLLPCQVFDVMDKRSEAQAFLDVNSRRTPVRAVDKFRVKVTTEDASAIAVKEMVESSGYKFSHRAQARGVACVSALLDEYNRSPELVRDIWPLVVEITGDQSIHKQIFTGMCYLETMLRKGDDPRNRSLLDPDNKQALLAAGRTAILRSMNEVAVFRGNKGGAKAWAEGLVRILNRKRRTRKIASPYDAPSE